VSKPEGVPRPLAIVLGVLLASVLPTGCGGPNTLRAEMDRAEDSARRAEGALDEADRRMDALDREGAEEAISEARKHLADPQITKYPEHGILKERLAAAESRLEEVKGEIVRRDLERAVLAERQRLDEAAERLEAAVEAMRRPSAAKDELDGAREAAAELEERLEGASELAAKDEPLAAHAAALRKRTASRREEIERFSRILSFRTGPLAARIEGVELAARAKAERDAEAAKELRGKAIDRFQACVTDGREMLVRWAELAKVKVEVEAGGKASTIGGVVEGCERQLDALAKAGKAKAAGKGKAAKAKAKGKAKKKR